jgi:type III secretion system regulator LcrR
VNPAAQKTEQGVDDRVTRRLRELGHEIHSYRISEKGPVLGMYIITGNSKIAFRMEDDDTLVVVLYQRVGPRQGLGNPFKDIICFLEFLRCDDLFIQRVRALIKPSYRKRPEDLSMERMKRFCMKYLGGRPVPGEWGDDWLCLDLKDYKPMRELRKTRHHS